MNNYRVTFSKNNNVNYWNNSKLQAESFSYFNELPNVYYPIIKEIIDYAQRNNIKHIWFFYEPHVEITWISDLKHTSRLLIKQIRRICKKHGINNVKVTYPQDGVFADWFCNSDEEREFGAKRHALCAEFVKLYNEYKEPVDNGKGLREQVKRTIHTLCNPLGLNYMDEAYICFSRGLICLLFRFFSFQKAVWIYTKIFRQKY